MNAENEAAMAELRNAVSKVTGVATTLGFGPRFLHSTGQAHKGGPATGLFLQFTDKPAADLPVPEPPPHLRPGHRQPGARRLRGPHRARPPSPPHPPRHGRREGPAEAPLRLLNPPRRPALERSNAGCPMRSETHRPRRCFPVRGRYRELHRPRGGTSEQTRRPDGIGDIPQESTAWSTRYSPICGQFGSCGCGRATSSESAYAAEPRPSA